MDTKTNKTEKPKKKYQYYINKDGELAFLNKRYAEAEIPPMVCGYFFRESDEHEFGVHII